jgi:DNA invertase Pin-like site-specific DNA recombinase
MKAALYARVSTDEQAIENQLPSAKTWCQTNNHELTEIYAENESAWKDGHQRELSRLLTDIRSGQKHFDYLIVWSLDRLCRQGIGPALQLISAFETYGVKVISLQESWTTAEGPMRDLFIAFIAWAAKFESDRKSARVKAANARRLAKGLPLGRRKGAKDIKPRKRTGYLLRYAKKGARQNYRNPMSKIEI